MLTSASWLFVSNNRTSDESGRQDTRHKTYTDILEVTLDFVVSTTKVALRLNAVRDKNLAKQMLRKTLKATAQ